MNTVLFTAAAGLVILAVVWIAVDQARRRARAEAEAETNRRMAERAEAQGRIIAEHREPEDAARRLDSGTF
jgi:uncharacterized membrane protein